MSDVLKHSSPEQKVKLVSYMVSTSYGLKPIASLKIQINGKQYEADSTGDGQYDAFVKALRKIYKEKLDRTFPLLQNYAVTIPQAVARMPWYRRSSPGTMMTSSGAHVDWTPTRRRLPFRPPSRCST